MARIGVYLSCRPEDAPYANEVRNAVHAAGYDHVDTPSTAITSAAFFISCISSNGYVSRELETAIEQVRSGARDPSWLMVVRLGDCSIPPLPVAGFTTLPEFVVRIGALESRLGKPAAAARVDLHTKATDVMAPKAEVFALKADRDAIAGQNIHSTTEVDKVVGDCVAIVGAVITTRTRKP
jgi:hypothetical protein